MKLEEKFNSDVYQNFQQISRKRSLNSPGGRYFNHSTVRRQVKTVLYDVKINQNQR